jgi:hypothetical protein
MQKNSFTRELMHKAIVETIIQGKPEEYKRIEQTERLRPKAARGNKTATNILANRAWYDKHKAWKKAYNAKYYQDNKEYWHNYYKYAHDSMKARQKFAKETATEAESTKKKYGADSQEYKRAKDRADANAKWALEDKAEFKIAKMNLERAIADQKWYSENTKRLKVTDAWLDGSKQIRSAGKNALSKLTKSLNVPTTKLSGFAKGVKGFFQK